MNSFLKSTILIFIVLLFISSCDEVGLYDESVIINDVLNNEEQAPLITQDIAVTYITSINDGLDNNTLKFKVDLSPNININSIIDLGLVYNETGEPSLSDIKVSSLSIEATNIIDVNDLLEGKTYNFRAFMITSQGVFYSSSILTVTVPETDCEIIPENNSIYDWYYLIDPEQNVYNALDVYEITISSPPGFYFSNSYQIYLYLNENEIQYIANGLDFDNFYDNNDVLTYTLSYSIPQGLTPSSCYTIRIIPLAAQWSDDYDMAVSSPFMILQ